MADLVRPPLIFPPLPHPKWWGINPDASESLAFLPTIAQASFNLYESGRPPPKLPPQIPGRMVGPQRPFKFYPLEGLPKKTLPDTPYVNITAALPTVTPPISIVPESVPQGKKIPPHVIQNLRSQPQASALGATNTYDSLPPLRKLPPHIPVRSLSQAPIIVTNLAQAQLEFDPTGKPTRVWPVEAVPPNIILLVTPVLPPPPRGPDYPSKVTLRWTEEAAYPNVAAQPPLIGIAQGLDDFSPTGLPKKQWYADPVFPTAATAPLAVIPYFTYDYPSVKARYWPEDAAAPNILTLPVFTTPGFNYEYPSQPRRVWPIEPAPQDFWALPSLATAPALYDYPALPPKRWPDPFPFTNWVQETPPLPLNPPPVIFDWPRHITLTLDNFQSPVGLAVSQVPTYIPEVGYEIYIPPRRFTIATPVRRFFITVPWRTFTISRKTVQTFDVKDPTEQWPLTFNMGPDLFVGETLIAPISVTVTLIQGADPNPSGILNGVAGFDQTQTMIVQPVTGGIAGCSYELIVTCPTTNPQKTLTLRGILPVQI